MAAEKKKKLEDLRSQRWYGPNDMRGISHRARSRQLGYGSEDIVGKPRIGIINTWSDMNTCHSHFKQRVEEIKRGVYEAGGFPIELPAMSLGEIHAYRHAGANNVGGEDRGHRRGVQLQAPLRSGRRRGFVVSSCRCPFARHRRRDRRRIPS